MKPIIFSTEMVKAILEGRKTQTRRIMKPQPQNKTAEIYGGMGPLHEVVFTDGTVAYIKYEPDTVAWVRESFCNIPVSPGGNARLSGKYYYKADEDIRPDGWRVPWKPSIHMPHAAARIFLCVRKIRAERLLDISDEDAIAEGFEGEVCNHDGSGAHGCTDCMNSGWIEPPQLHFMYYWDELNEKRGYPWSSNPWVWVYEFEVIQK